MRIRKNAGKLSISSPSSNTHINTHLVCQLNQSPWDVITFPSPPNYSSDSSHLLPLHHFQGGGGFGFNENGSFGSSSHSIGANYSDGSGRVYMESEVRLDVSEEGETKVGFNNGEEEEEKKIIEDDDEDEEEEEIVLCCETNGKGWQCGKVVKKGNNMCARHLKKCVVSESTLNNKASETTPVRRGRGRPRNKKNEPAPTPTPTLTLARGQEPNEFYYYSGFGPLWGKKKGPGRSTNGDASGIDHEPATTMATKVVQKNEEIDYMECDDDDEEDDQEREIGKKRGRKRIKARSLKSLM